LNDVVKGQSALDFGCSTVAYANCTETFVHEFEIVEEISISAINFRNNSHSALPILVEFVNQLNRLPSDQISHS